MTWSEIASNWHLWFATFSARIPNLDAKSAKYIKHNENMFIRYVAEQNQLTAAEARDLIEEIIAQNTPQEKSA